MIVCLLLARLGVFFFLYIFYYIKNYVIGIGFPQGGVCSAKFWIIAFNEAIEIINEYGVTGQGFADDCGPMIGGDNTHDMYKSML